MNRDTLEEVAAHLRGFRRDRENGLFFGVCAGLADRFGWPLLTVRLLAATGLLVLTLPTAVVYLMAGLLLPAKPLTYYGSREDQFWRSGGRRRSRRYCT
jgi:phage shock protein C